MISVIVPVYNTEKVLCRCIDSIINQTYKNLEIILINDGSTDNSLEICNEYRMRDKRIKVLNQSNQGQGAARNYGLNISSGKYISFVDSDDYINEYMYEKMITKLEHYEADMSICGYCRDHGFIIKKPKVPQENTVFNNKELIKAYISTSYITSSVCNKLYKKELWDECRFPITRAREDVSVLHIVLSRVNKAVHIGDSTYVQYVRPGSTERKRFTKDKLQSIVASQKRNDYIMNVYPELEKYIFLNTANTYANLMKEILASFCYYKYKQEYREMFEKLNDEINKNYSIRYLDIDLYNKLKDIIDKQNKFIILNSINGMKNVLINILTYVLFIIKR